MSDDDAMHVLDCMASGTKWCVVVGDESVATTEVVVKAVMDRVSKGELQQRHERLKNLQFVPLSAASFQRKPREELRSAAASASAGEQAPPRHRRGVRLARGEEEGGAGSLTVWPQ